tara:strand:- start:20410 stop:21600 length:1191 start_codon:yes stop_codon:yes gene_type:complete
VQIIEDDKESKNTGAHGDSKSEILKGGPSYFRRYIRLIEEARNEIHLQIYTFENDSTGILVQRALIRAANRGVKVYLVLDGFGSGHLTNNFLNKFHDSGIEVRFFSKLRLSVPIRMGRRLHQKLLVVDGHRAVVGGINIANRYYGTHKSLPWLDFAVFLEGEVCVRLHNLAIRILKKESVQKVVAENHWLKHDHLNLKEINVLENDFFKNKLQIRQSYHRAIRNAQHSVLLFASYFFPSYRQLKLLEGAARRGVDIHLVLPHKSDVLFYSTAVKYYYGRLLRKGIHIYEYQPAILHAKVAVADDRWCTVGSYNLNDLSDLLSIELNVEIFDLKVVGDFSTKLRQIIKTDCLKISKKDFEKPSPIYHFLWKSHYFILVQSLKVLYWMTDKNKDYQIE